MFARTDLQICNRYLNKYQITKRDHGVQIESSQIEPSDLCNITYHHLKLIFLQTTLPSPPRPSFLCIVIVLRVAANLLNKLLHSEW